MPPLPARLATMRSRLPSIENALNAFISSASRFRILQTIQFQNNTLQSILDPEPAPGTLDKLWILDSSFNPPTRGHAWMATEALRSQRGNSARRLLLLFSVHNADKKAAPAPFAHRVVMMALLAEDILQSVSASTAADPAETDAPTGNLDVAIDIGLTKEPYYTDKSTAISAADSPFYPHGTKHVHLIGYDTFIRFVDPKYYTTFSPPLSALAPFFEEGYGLRVAQRPYDAEDESSKAFGTEAEQEGFVKALGASVSGDEGQEKARSLAEKGWKMEWGKLIELVSGAEEARGVSSSRVRRAVKTGEWGVVKGLCTEGVAGWIEDGGLYMD